MTVEEREVRSEAIIGMVEREKAGDVIMYGIFYCFRWALMFRFLNFPIRLRLFIDK